MGRHRPCRDMGRGFITSRHRSIILLLNQSREIPGEPSPRVWSLANVLDPGFKDEDHLRRCPVHNLFADDLLVSCVRQTKDGTSDLLLEHMHERPLDSSKQASSCVPPQPFEMRGAPSCSALLNDVRTYWTSLPAPGQCIMRYER